MAENISQELVNGYPPSYPNYTNQQQYLQDEKPINWNKYLFLFIRSWYWFLITLGIAIAVAFIKIRYTIPQYQSTATLIIEQEENTQNILNEFRAVRLWKRQLEMANENAKLSSFSTIKRTVDSLNHDIFWTGYGRIRVRHLYQNPRFKLSILSDSTEWYKNKEWFIDYIDNTSFHFYNKNEIDTILPLEQVNNIKDWQFRLDLKSEGVGHMTYSFIVNDLVLLSKQYKRKLQIESDERNGTIITLRSTGVVGEREVEFLNTLCNVHILSGLERKQLIASNTSTFLDEQLSIILDSLNKVETQMVTFRMSNDVINLSREGEMAFEQLKRYHEQITQLKLNENYYYYLQDYIQQRNDPQTIIAPTIGNVNDQLLIGAVTELQQLYEERENLDISVMANNPGINNINERIRSVRLRVLEIVKGLIENNKFTLDQIKTEQQATITQLKSLPISEQQLVNIKRKFDLYNQFYTFLLEKSTEAGIQKVSTISNTRILDSARSDHLIEVGNNKKYIIIIAVLIGLLLPIIILLLYDKIDNRITERDDILNNTNVPLIGIIGHALEGDNIPVKMGPNSSFSESLRRIRTNLTFTLRGAEKKVILITSSVSGEGKTFCAANLATIIAMNNKKVLLVGCDLRKPALHNLFHTSNEKGISSYIIGQHTIEEIIIETTFENLSLIPAGPIPPNPAELIETRKMQELFDKVKEEYDYIIIDTPPVALVADSLALASHADTTLYIIRQNQSKRSVLGVVNSISSENKLPNLYLLINDIKPSKNLGYNYYYGYAKDYSYGYSKD